MMRIISGSARGTRLTTLDGDNTRPTLERTKEALFSSIQFSIRDRSVLDLFAGSGQLALEALSRGASRADIVDASAKAAKIIKENVTKTHFERKADVHVKDFKAFLSTCRGKYGLVFLDPPYATSFLPDAIELLQKNNLFDEEAILICEMDSNDTDTEKKLCDMLFTDFSLIKNSVYAKSRVMIFEKE